MSEPTPTNKGRSLLQLRRTELEAVHRMVRGLPLPASPLWEDFPQELERLAEISFSAGLDAVGLMTKGLGRGFLRRLGSRVRTQVGPRAEEEIGLLRQVLESSARPSLFVKLDEGIDGVEELSWYFTEEREPLAALDLLARLGVARGVLDALDASLAELAAPALFLGRSLPLEGPGRFAIYAPILGSGSGSQRTRGNGASGASTCRSSPLPSASIPSTSTVSWARDPRSTAVSEGGRLRAKSKKSSTTFLR